MAARPKAGVRAGRAGVWVGWAGPAGVCVCGHADLLLAEIEAKGGREKVRERWSGRDEGIGGRWGVQRGESGGGR